jgi:hypothetical protein
MFFQFKSYSRDVWFHLQVEQKQGTYSLMLIEDLTLLAMGVGHLLRSEMILFGLQDFLTANGPSHTPDCLASSRTEATVAD